MTIIINFSPANINTFDDIKQYIEDTYSFIYTQVYFSKITIADCAEWLDMACNNSTYYIIKSHLKKEERNKLFKIRQEKTQNILELLAFYEYEEDLQPWQL